MGQAQKQQQAVALCMGAWMGAGKACLQPYCISRSLAFRDGAIQPNGVCMWRSHVGQGMEWPAGPATSTYPVHSTVLLSQPMLGG